MSIITEIAPQVTVPEGMIADADLALATPNQMGTQGDVSIIPLRSAKAATAPIPTDGVTIAVGNGGHHHTLYGAGSFDAHQGDEMVYGTLTVPAGGMVLLLHTDPSRRLSDEHGAVQVTAGTYRIGGQREQADEIRRVAD